MYKQKISVVQTLTSAPWNLNVRGIQHPKPDKYFFYQDKLPTIKYSTEPNAIWDQGLFTTELFSDDIARVIIQKAGLSDAGGTKKNAPNRLQSPHREAMKELFTSSSGHSLTPYQIPLTVWWARCCAQRLEPVVGGAADQCLRLSVSRGLMSRCRHALIVLALPFRRAFVPGHINKQSQNHMHGEHCNNGCIEVAVRAWHLHRTWEKMGNSKRWEQAAALQFHKFRSVSVAIWNKYVWSIIPL